MGALHSGNTLSCDNERIFEEYILGDVKLKLFSKVPALNLVISKYPKSLGAL